MTKNDHKKKMLALALRIRKKFGKFGSKATEGIIMRLTGGDKEAVRLLRLLNRQDALRERERKMTKRGRKDR